MRRFKVVLPILLGVITTPAIAGYAPAGYVMELAVRNNGVVTFRGGPQTVEACQTSANAGLWAFDSTNAAGQAKLATLLTAYASHKRVFVGGTSNCAVVSGVETVDFLQLADP